MEMKVVAPIRVGDKSLARYRPGQGCRGLPADFMRFGASTWTYLQVCDLQAAVRRLHTLGYSRFDVVLSENPIQLTLGQRRIRT